MNLTINTKPFQLTTAAGLLLGTAVAVSAASSIVTFQVDMTAQIQNSTFTPGVNVVNARGSFNGWGTSLLTNNPAGVNTNLYRGTFDDTSDANGATVYDKYCIGDGVWDSMANNRQWGLPAANGGSVVLPAYFFNNVAPTNLVPVTDDVTFQVDMTQQITLGNFTPGTSTVYIRGSYNGWGGGTAMTNDPAGTNPKLYSMTVTGSPDLPDSPQFYKYFVDTGALWENSPPMLNADGSGNRVYNLLQTDGVLVLPAVYFNDQGPVPPITNVITFQVDMSVQASIGKFDPSLGDYVEARGSFQGWSSGFTLTNRPAPDTNVYVGVWTIVNNPGTAVTYKFWDTKFPGNYENPISTGGANRSFNLLTTNGNIVVADVLFSDIQLSDVLPTETVVTFSVNMTNAVGTDSHVFNPSADSVYINGDFLGWPTWDVLLPQVTNNPVGSGIYTFQQTFAAGSFLPLTYKYSINGIDNEAGFGQNHLRYIRSGGNYVLPLDKFGTALSEPQNGNIAIGAQSGGKVPVSWLGTPGILLQTAASLSSPIHWTTVPGTAGLGPPNGYLSPNGFVSLTNYTVGPNPTYFRWVKPGTQPAP